MRWQFYQFRKFIYWFVMPLISVIFYHHSVYLIPYNIKLLEGTRLQGNDEHYTLRHVWVIALSVFTSVEQIVFRSLFRVKVATVLLSDRVNVNGESRFFHLLYKEWNALLIGKFIVNILIFRVYSRGCIFWEKERNLFRLKGKVAWVYRQVHSST